MDITIDCGYLYFGTNCVRKLEDDLYLLQNAMNKIDLSSVSGELSSAGTFDSLSTSLKGILENDVDDLVVRLDNIKRILVENDRQAAYLFNYYEEGIINGDFQFTEMPLMSQTDYNDIAYSQGTIKTSGCGLTSVCMVASYLTGNLYTPSELVGATRGYGDNVSRMLAAAKSVGLVWHNDSGTSHDDLDAYLREGKIAVVLVRDSGHFVVCTGITEDGKYLVNDPYGPWVLDRPYTRSELNFTAGNTWIFDPAENQGVKQNLDDSITVSGTAAEKIQSETGYVDRTDRGDVPVDNGNVQLREEDTTPITQPSTSVSTEPKTQASTQPQTEPKTQASTQPQTEPKTEVKTQPKTEPKTEAKTEPKTQPNTEPKTEAKTEPKTQPKTEPKTEAKTEPKTQPKTEPKTEAKTEPKTQPKTEPKTEAKTEPKTQPKTEPKTEVITQPQTLKQPYTNPSTSAPVAPTSPKTDASISNTIPEDDIVNSTPGVDSSNDIYDDINTDDDYDYDNVYEDYDDYDEGDSVEHITVSNEIKENDGDLNKLLIPGLVVTAGVATAGGIVYAANSKKKDSDKTENLDLDEYDDEETEFSEFNDFDKF